MPRPWPASHTTLALLLLATLCLQALVVPAQALTDDGSDIQAFASSYDNIEQAANSQDVEVTSAFNGDAERYTRSSESTGYIEYESSDGFSQVSLSFFAYLGNNVPTPSFTLTVFLDGLQIFQVGSEKLATVVSQPVSNGPLILTGSSDIVVVEINNAGADGWYPGTLLVDALKADVANGCKKTFRLQISGGNKSTYWAYQVGTVEIKEVSELGDDAASVCGSGASACPRSAESECQPLDESQLRTYYDDASATDKLYQTTNLGVRRDDKDVFDDDSRYVRSDPSLTGTIVYRFSQFKFAELHISVALRYPNERVLSRIQLNVRPYTSVQCKPEPSPTKFQEYSLQQLKNGWSTVEVKYGVGPLPGLNCELPSYVELSFFAPSDADIQIMSVKVIGEGEIDVLPDSIGSGEGTPLYIWLIIGGTALIVVLLLALLVWCCMCRNGDLEQEDIQPVNSSTGAPKTAQEESTKPQEGLDSRYHARKLSGGQVVVPINAYGAANSDRESATAPHNGYSPLDHAALQRALQNSRHTGHPQQQLVSVDVARHDAGGAMHASGLALEPEVDLAHVNGAGLVGVPSAPRQDIFDTWQQTGLSGYQTGDEELSGPLDTRQHSWTPNPPLSNTVTSPSGLSNSGMGVTAQLGMRLSELQGMQQDHERMAKGELDTGGNETSIPEPLGVTYGARIGIGGFGSVFEGLWNGKQVAVKVIKMPHEATPGEDKSRMAFMEYAVSGILLHENIVATHQADIRPVFLEQDDGQQSTGDTSRVGWTNVSDFLGNDDISRQITRSLRIQEWEIRIVMEYCNMGNLKEAIRSGKLMYHGRTRALDCALLALDIAKGCFVIHKHKIIHGDLKPHNVLLTSSNDDPRGWVGKIADFGLSVKIKRGEEHVSGIQHGTEGYVAPEVMTTRRMVKASDVYSFGILMWEMWHSRLYYEEYRAAVKRMRRPNIDFRPTFERGCPDEYKSLATSCWASNPEGRPDFKRVEKMMNMIITSIKDQVRPDGTLQPPT